MIHVRPSPALVLRAIALWPSARVRRTCVSQLAAALAAGLESVTLKCDEAKAAVSEACPPSGLLHWNCSADCPDAECDINFGGLGLFGTIPEIGDLRCAHRFARV